MANVSEPGIAPPPREFPGMSGADWLRSAHYQWLLRLVGVFPRVRVFTPSLTPVSVAANTSAEQTFTVAGLRTGDVVTVNGPAPTAGCAPVHARVSADDTLALAFMNTTAGGLTPAAGTYAVLATRR